MSYWAGADGAGHLHGPDSAEVREALEAQDQELVRLLRALDEKQAWAHTTLLVVSDHGMMVRGESLELGAALEAAGIQAQVFGATTAHVFLNDLADLDRAEQTARALENVQVFRRESVPPALRLHHPTRTGDLVVLAEPPFTLDRPAGIEGQMMMAAQALGRDFGMHGYDPALPDMGGAFLALGRGATQGARLGLVRQIDVAATVAGLLGIDPPLQSEGRAIDGIAADQRPTPESCSR
jgi:alkaline phosphatase D